MKCSPPKSIKQVKDFLQVSNCIFSIKDKIERNKFIKKTTWNLKYKYLTKKEKGLVIRYLATICGISKVQTKRLVSKAVKGILRDPKTTRNQTSFQKKYSQNDVHLLAQLDEALNFPNGIALQHHLQRMFNVYGDNRFERLANISHGHIYNLRKTNIYRKFIIRYNGTKPTSNNEIGIREKPNVLGSGYLRVDSVHGGEKDGQKGVYYINLVDELLQWEIVTCVEGISERYLKDVWEDLLEMFPFVIHQFHSDNGSEFINKIVADILNKLMIRQSKSRPRRSNDNGLVESKNGWVIRKHFGYMYVNSKNAPLINEYLMMYFNNYLNYHRACAFPSKEVLENGKVKISYRKKDYRTPYEKLKEVDPEGRCLREGVTYDMLESIHMKDTDLDYVMKMNEEYLKLRKQLAD